MTKRLPNVEVSSVHRAAGAYNGTRPPSVKDDLIRSWKSTDRAVKKALAKRYDRGGFSLHFEDANRRGMTARDWHDEAVMLFDDDPDYGIAVAPKGWRVNRQKTKHETFNIGLESMHQGHFVTVVFEEIHGDREVEATGAFGNIGRAASKGRAREVWDNFYRGARKAMFVCVVELQEGDDYNERAIYRDLFDRKTWHRYFVKKSRNAIAVRRRKDESIWNKVSRLVAKGIAHMSPPRRLNRVVVSVPAK